MEQAILRFFEGIRCPFLTCFFGVFSFLGEGTALIAAVALCYWLLDRRTGEQLLVTAVSSLAVNTFLKNTVRRPRPYVAGDSSLLEVQNAFLDTTNLGDRVSCPSGHSQSVANFLTASGFYAPKKFLWFVYLAVTLLVMVSRLYFGVHYPSDVALGFLVGVVIAVLWQLVYRKAYFCRYPILGGLAVLSMVPFFFPAFQIPHDHVQAVGLICGCAFFLPFADMVRTKPSKYPKRLLRIAVGGALVGAIFALSLLLPKGEVFSLVKYFFLVGGATLGADALFRLFKI